MLHDSTISSGIEIKPHSLDLVILPFRISSHLKSLKSLTASAATGAWLRWFRSASLKSLAASAGAGTSAHLFRLRPLSFPGLKSTTSNSWSAVQDTFFSTKASSPSLIIAIPYAACVSGVSGGEGGGGEEVAGQARRLQRPLRLHRHLPLIHLPHQRWPHPLHLPRPRPRRRRRRKLRIRRHRYRHRRRRRRRHHYHRGHRQDCLVGVYART